MFEMAHHWCDNATMDLNLLSTFAAVHTAGSFSLAAEKLKVPRSTVSRAVAALENELDVQLFHRTTRSVSTTTTGQALYERVAPALMSLESSVSELPEREEAPSGVLKITAPVDLGSTLLAEAAARFVLRYPHARIETRITNETVDLVRESFDLAVRISGKPLRDSTLIVRRIGRITAHLYAAPSYLARKGTPREREDLEGNHDCVGFSRGKGMFFPHARVVGDEMFFMREVIKAGAGIGALPSFLADADEVAGTLVRVIPKWVMSTSVVHLVQPPRKHVPRKTTAFVEVLDQLLRQKPIANPG
jgi:DNA-binding transcriptional LysR family regulator